MAVDVFALQHGSRGYGRGGDLVLDLSRGVEMQVYIHYIYTAFTLCLHYIYITLRYVTLPYITLHYLTLPYITLHYVTLRYIALHYVTSPYNSLHYVTLHHFTLCYITLHYVFSTSQLPLKLLVLGPNFKIFPRREHDFVGNICASVSELHNGRLPKRILLLF